MKFKLDENLPLEIADAFRDSGHEIDSVQSEGLGGASDLTILDRVQTENRILLTLDKGIADIRLFPPAQYPGIVLFRPATSGRGEVKKPFLISCRSTCRDVWRSFRQEASESDKRGENGRDSLLFR